SAPAGTKPDGLATGTRVGVGWGVGVGGSTAGGGVNVGGGPASTVCARAIGFTVGVDSTVIFTVRGRLSTKNAPATATTSSPTASAIHGSRLDGSGPGGAGRVVDMALSQPPQVPCPEDAQAAGPRSAAA